MKCIRLVGLCLIAAFAMSAFAATGALADNPEYGRCLKQNTGGTKYSSSKCTVEGGTGQYEWIAGVPPKPNFTAALKPTTIATLVYGNGTKITCNGLSVVGEYTGVKTVSISQWDFSGCEGGGGKCNSAGAGTGVIKVKELEGELGVIKKAKPTTSDQIGNVLWPKGGTPLSESMWVEYVCGGITEKAKNSLINAVTENAMDLTVTVKYTSTNANQKPEHFEGEPNMFLENKFAAAPYEPWGWSMTMDLTNEEKVEIRSL